MPTLPVPSILATRKLVCEQMRSTLAALRTAFASVQAAGAENCWVLENQGFYLCFDTDGTPRHGGVLQARIYRDDVEAKLMARRSTNGNARHPIVVRYTAALLHEIEETDKLIATLSGEVQ